MKKAVLCLIVLSLIGTAGCIDDQPVEPTTLNYLENIPPKPDDFDLVMRDINTKYTSICDLSENYYIQPEFYGDSWVRGQRSYENHDYTRWAVHGHGAFPGNPTFVFTTPSVGSWISECVFYRTGWGIETYQGIKLIPNHSEYFDVIITPDEFLLPPTYPKFSEGWVKKLNVVVKIKDTPPDGIYIIHVRSAAPSYENSERWYKETFGKNISREQYIMLEECIEQGVDNCDELIEVARKNKYIDSGIFQMGSRIIITVIVET